MKVYNRRKSDLAMEDVVKAYYGKELKSSADLKTSACCDANAISNSLKQLLAKVHPEVCKRYYGCGLVCPELIEGFRVLDLGSGAGRDVYILAQLVGAKGNVVGVDMTKEQLEIAQKYKEYHAEQFGYANVEFIEGRIEELTELGLGKSSFDLIVSNCVLNLSTNKPAVLKGIKHLLKPTGTFYFADVYSDQQLPQEISSHPVLYSECLGGALYWRDFEEMAIATGFRNPELINVKDLEIDANELKELVADIKFSSRTYKLTTV